MGVRNGGLRIRTIAVVALAALAVGLAPVASAEPTEDSPSWDCVTDGNRVCGPTNPRHVPAGCYDDGGVLFAVWPCAAWRRHDYLPVGVDTYTRID